MIEIRHEYREQLAQIERQTLEALDMAITALDRAMESLVERDVELASMVVVDDDRIDGRYLEIHQAILSLLALQAPVAGDLRIVAALLHVIRHVERMGDQCVSVARMVPLDGLETPTDRVLLEQIQQMGELVRGQAVQSRRAFAGREMALAESLATRDREVNQLNTSIFQRAVEIGDDPELREWAMHMILVARCLERFGDNAVDIGEQTAFVVTGLFREFSDGVPGAPSD
jgi:phosphate transport system protein